MFAKGYVECLDRILARSNSKLSPTASTADWRTFTLLFWIAVLLGGAVLLIVYAANHLDSAEANPEVLLPLIVITGVVALMATLAVAAALFNLFNISDKNQALGLPAGSVQAVIALSLILIFAVVALYASSSSGAEQLISTGLTEEEFKAIPPSQVVSSKRLEENGAVSYEVVRSIEDPSKKDLNTQLLTTVSTLVVAVAGFYFGSKSVQEGNETASEGILAASGGTRSVTLTEPASPYTWEKGQEMLVIKVQVVPGDAKLQTEVQNDGEFQLGEVSSGTFVYRPGPDAPRPGTVNLQFSQVDDPTVSASLIVNFSGEEAEDPAEVQTPGPAGDSEGGGDPAPAGDGEEERAPSIAEERQAHLHRTAQTRPRL